MKYDGHLTQAQMVATLRRSQTEAYEHIEWNSATLALWQHEECQELIKAHPQLLGEWILERGTDDKNWPSPFNHPVYYARSYFHYMESYPADGSPERLAADLGSNYHNTLQETGGSWSYAEALTEYLTLHGFHKALAETFGNYPEFLENIK